MYASPREGEGLRPQRTGEARRAGQPAARSATICVQTSPREQGRTACEIILFGRSEQFQEDARRPSSLDGAVLRASLSQPAVASARAMSQPILEGKETTP